MIPPSRAFSACVSCYLLLHLSQRANAHIKDRTSQRRPNDVKCADRGFLFLRA
jgi:hypothetical protein